MKITFSSLLDFSQRPQVFKKIRAVTVWTAALTLLLALSACGISLASDVTPPPNPAAQVGASAQLGAATPADNGIVGAAATVPQSLSDPAQGAPIYADLCASCHGATGQGDGPDSGQGGKPATKLADPAILRSLTPAQMFSIVSDGSSDRTMPAYATELTESQRWDVIATLYSFINSPDAVAAGKVLYPAECATCHLPDGSIGLNDPTIQVDKSDNDLFAAITSGSSTSMPAYASKYNETQRWSLVAYVRSLSMGSSQGPSIADSGGTGQTAVVPAPAGGAATPTPVSGTPQPTPTIAVFTGNVKGKLTLPNGATLPAGTKVTLMGYDTMTQSVNTSADVQPDGTYSFQGVEFAIGRAFIASVNYNGMDFDSSMIVVEAGMTELDLPISLETSTDTSVLVVENMHVLFDFSIPNTVQVAQFFVISNPTNKTVAPVKAGTALLSFDLPLGATNLRFQDGQLGQRYIQTAKGFADTFNIPPDSQVAQPFEEVFAFELPYKASLNLTLPISLDIANVSVLLPSDGTTLQSSQLQSAGPMSATGGTTYNVYSAGALPKGSTLSMAISGQPGNVPATTSDLQTILISAGVFLLVLVMGGLWLFRARLFVKARPIAEVVPAPASYPDDDPDDLIDQIAALDDLFKAGSLPETAYQERRGELKEHLKSSFK